PLADHFAVTVRVGNRPNKGWAGQTLERFLDRPQDSSRDPDFGDWELKATSLKRSPRGRLVPKETMAITMIDPDEVVGTEFEDSHLLRKLGRIVLVARIFEGQDERRSLIHSVQSFDLNDPVLRGAVREDYDLIRDTIRTAG